ncbi:MAG: HpcH/HpaI aldolase/citrate lyase family protein [Bacillota bacterium]
MIDRLRTVLLFVPSDRQEFFPKAAASAADTLIFDLEDAVAQEKKESSRSLLDRVLKEESFGRKELAVRVNSLTSSWGRDDLTMVVHSGIVRLIIIPKAEPHEIRLTDQLLGNSCPDIICLIETARGLQMAYETALASKRVVGMMLGAEDLSTEMNLKRTASGYEIGHARHVVALAAYAASVQPIDTPYLQIDDLDGLRRDTIQAREIGFTAKASLSPKQVPVIREVFRPDPEEVKKAMQILLAAEEAESKGRGVITFEGAMIDAPVVARARRLVEIAREVEGDDH